MNMHNSHNDAPEFLSTRLLEAAPERVWQAFAEAEQLAQWWGPKGCSIEVARLEFVPGGVFHYQMRLPQAITMWGRFTYRELRAPHKLVFINGFSDPHGGIVRAPFNPAWPLEVLNSVSLAPQAGGTLLSLTASPLGSMPAEYAVFQAGFASMQQGFDGAWDQLAAYLVRG